MLTVSVMLMAALTVVAVIAAPLIFGLYSVNIADGVDPDVYREQFGIRSRNWHESARWLTDDQLLSEHAACFELPEDLGSTVWLLVNPSAFRRPEVKAFSAFFAPRYSEMFSKD